jgi:hypothetical protein
MIGALPQSTESIAIVLAVNGIDGFSLPAVNVTRLNSPRLVDINLLGNIVDY